MAASNNEVDQYTGLTAGQHARFMKESDVQNALKKFKAKLQKEEQAKQGQTTESPLSAFFSNLPNPFATSSVSASSNSKVAQPMPAHVSDDERKIRILIWGDDIVHKTALAKRLSGEINSMDLHTASLEIDGQEVKVIFFERENVQGDRPVRRFENDSSRRGWVNGADVIFLCYNVHDRDSFQHITDDYKMEIDGIEKDKKIILVADNSDLIPTKERVVTQQEGEQLGKDLTVPHVEISIATGEGCYKLLEEAASLALQTRRELSNSASSSSSSNPFGFGKRS